MKVPGFGLAFTITSIADKDDRGLPIAPAGSAGDVGYRGQGDTKIEPPPICGDAGQVMACRDDHRSNSAVLTVRGGCEVQTRARLQRFDIFTS